MVIHLISTSQRGRTLRGFSLVELLTVVAIIGILASLAVISVTTNYYDAVTYTHDQRNAQDLVEVCASAQAAGLNFVVDNDLMATINKVIAGGTPGDGAFQGQVFALPNLSSQDIQGAAYYLTVNGSALVYHSDRAVPNTLAMQ